MEKWNDGGKRGEREGDVTGGTYLYIKNSIGKNTLVASAPLHAFRT